MLYKGAGLSSDIYLDTVDPAVAHVRDREIDHTISAQEREGADRTVLFKSLYPDMISGKINNS